jgi:hypothetical protein
MCYEVVHPQRTCSSFATAYQIPTSQPLLLCSGDLCGVLPWVEEESLCDREPVAAAVFQNLTAPKN